MEKTCTDLVRESLEKSITYDAYRKMVSLLAQQNGTTGTEQTPSRIHYTRLNDQRMKRWDKTLKFSEAIKTQIERLERKVIWLVITESWCGDAAPSLPLMHKIATINPRIDLRIVLRDGHLELMDCYRTDGALSIPKLLVLDRQSGEVLYTWGPRPPTAAAMVADFKKENGSLTPAFREGLQIWYNKDKGEDILQDLLLGLSLE
jgi:hypothetical protein